MDAIQLDMTELIDALVSWAENKEAAKTYSKAQRVIKKLLPSVQEYTKFSVGEHWSIFVSPEDRDGFEVKPGRIQRKTVLYDDKPATADNS